MLLPVGPHGLYSRLSLVSSHFQPFSPSILLLLPPLRSSASHSARLLSTRSGVNSSTTSLRNSWQNHGGFTQYCCQFAPSCWLFHYCCSHALQQYASSSGFRGLIFVSFLERISPTVLPGSLQSRAACGARPEAGASATASPCANTR